MRIGELSRRSGTSIPTIKYYVREGLVHAGEATARNQAQYDDSHLVRLALIRALREGAGLSIATLGRVFTAMEAHVHDARPAYLALAVRALSEPLEVDDDQAADYEAAGAQVDELMRTLGWDTSTDSPGRDDLVRALVALHRFAPGTATDVDAMRPYAEAARTLAEAEIPPTFDSTADPQEALRFSVLGTVLFEPVLLALRKLAHVDRIRHLATVRTPPQRPSPRRAGERRAMPRPE